MTGYLQAFDTLFQAEGARRPEDRADDCAATLPQSPAQVDEGRLPQANALEAMLGVHEYERQRLGQELHDSAGQLLVSLQLSVTHLLEVETNHGHDALLREINDTVRRIDREIRALAFLDYPAELGERGLCVAVQALARGFAKRTGIRTSFSCRGDRTAVDASIAKAMLRVAQEALTNIYRHSHATYAKVLLERGQNQLRLTISDDGVGVPDVGVIMARGIGLPGMRHRIEFLGGRFQMRNLKRGTRISATVPIEPGMSAA